MKTANKIAAETYAKFSGETMDEDMIAGLIAEGIEADRAQRADDLATLADAAANWTTELADYVIPGASSEEAAAHEEECNRITAAISRYLDEKESE